MKSSKMNTARTLPDGEDFVPVAYLNGGAAKNGKWAFCVPRRQLDGLVDALAFNQVPEVDGAICLLTEDGRLAKCEEAQVTIAKLQSAHHDLGGAQRY